MPFAAVGLVAAGQRSGAGKVLAIAHGGDLAAFLAADDILARLEVREERRKQQQEDKGSEHRSAELRQYVGNDVAPDEAPPGRECNRDAWIDVGAADAADDIN